MDSAFEAFQNEDYKEALYFYETAHQTLPKDTLALLNILHVYLKLNNYDSAAYTANRLLKNTTYRHPSVFTLIATNHLRNGNREMARQAIKNGLIENPAYLPLWLMKADLELELKEYNEAISTYNYLIEQFNYPIYNNYIAQIYQELEEWDAAILYYKKTLELYTDNLIAVQNLIYLYAMKGEILIDQSENLPLEQIKEFKTMRANAQSFFTKALEFIKISNQLVEEKEDIKEFRLRLERRIVE